MPQAALPYIGAATGLFGVLQASKQADMAQGAINRQKKAEYYPNLATKEGYNIAHGYDPAMESKVAVDAAIDAGAKMLSTAMSGNKAKFSAIGGVPGGDTAFSLKQLGTMKNYVDPLKMFTANLLANASQAKLNMLMQIAGKNTVSPAAQMMAMQGQSADFASPLALFSQSMGNIFPGKGGTPSIGAATRPGAFFGAG